MCPGRTRKNHSKSFEMYVAKMIAMLICAFVAIVSAADFLEGRGRLVPIDSARHQARSAVR